MNNNIKELDYLALFSAFLSVLNYSENLRQTLTDELMTELKTQNQEYLEKIIKNQEKILRRINNGN